MPEDVLNVAVDAPMKESTAARVRAISPRIRLLRPPDAAALASAQVLFTGKARIDPAAMPKLRWIQLNTAAVEDIDQKPILQCGKPVANVSGAYTPAVSEFAIGLLVAARRKFLPCYQLQRERRWPSDDRWDDVAGRNCWGTTLGLVGYGSIGRHIARIADAMGMKVLAYKRNASARAEHNVFRPDGTGDPEGRVPVGWYDGPRLPEMLSKCDGGAIVTLPITRATLGLVDRAAIDALPRTSVLVGIGRGGVIDERALADALRGHRIFGAALDVYETEPPDKSDPLWDVPDLIMVPHLASWTVDQAEWAGRVLEENLRRYLTGEPLINIVSIEDGY